MKSAVFTFILSLFIMLAQAQDDSTFTKNNNVTINKEAGITKIVETYKATYQLSGYRIQIGSENKSQDAKKIRAIFVQQFKNIPAYELYQQPYYKVRVGNFKTKLEAVKFQQEISSQYPNSFIVKDNIEFLNEN